MENRNVHTGSASFHSGCRDKQRNHHTNSSHSRPYPTYTYFEPDDVPCNNNPNALNQVSQHMDEGSMDIDILELWKTPSLASPFLPPTLSPSPPMTMTAPSMTVPMAVLMKYSHHTEQGGGGNDNERGEGWGEEGRGGEGRGDHMKKEECRYMYMHTHVHLHVHVYTGLEKHIIHVGNGCN